MRLFHKLPRRGAAALVYTGVQILGGHLLPGPFHFSTGEAKNLPWRLSWVADLLLLTDLVQEKLRRWGLSFGYRHLTVSLSQGPFTQVLPTSQAKKKKKPSKKPTFHPAIRQCSLTIMQLAPLLQHWLRQVVVNPSCSQNCVQKSILLPLEHPNHLQPSQHFHMAPRGTYLGVMLKVERTFWHRELEDSLLYICLSGVVRGSNMHSIKKKKKAMKWAAWVFIAMQATSDISQRLSKIPDLSSIFWHAFFPSPSLQHAGMANSNTLTSSFDWGSLFSK